MYYDYKNARDLAWKILINYRLTKYPLDIRSLIKAFKIPLLPYSDVQSLSLAELPQDAFTAPVKGHIAIFYNPAMPYKRIRFTFAHELGHILLGHVPSPRGFPKNKPEEHTANIFASRLLMPAIIIRHYNLKSAGEITSFFDVSDEAADIRLKCSNVLKTRNKFLTSPLEREYYTVFLKDNKA